MGKRERGIQSRTVLKIKQTFPGSFVRVKHGTAYATVGDPDIYGCCPHLRGRMFGFEVKNEDGELTRIQRFRLKELRESGAIVGAIRDPWDAVNLLLEHVEGK